MIASFYQSINSYKPKGPFLILSSFRVDLHADLLERNLEIMFRYYGKEQIQSYLEQSSILY